MRVCDETRIWCDDLVNNVAGKWFLDFLAV